MLENSQKNPAHPLDAEFFSADLKSIGNELHALASELFPICRSVTGDGVRQTLEILRKTAHLQICEIPTGTKVFDWEVPQEWNIRDAYVKNARGERVIDFQLSNLHLVNGSHPVYETLNWSALKQKLHTLTSQPDCIPYITNFSKNDWGFCLSQIKYDELEALGDHEYEVVIDASVRDGSLTYGELFLPGQSDEEFLFSAHICHPSLANDNLSGLCIAILLAKKLMQIPKRRYTYRFLFAPATIGAISWLAQNQPKLERVKHGLILSLLGDPGQSTYKRSRQGNAKINQVAEHVLRTSTDPYDIREFTPFGYDERQFCSPGINLAMGCLMRTPDGEFAEYHTSGDNLDFIKPEFLADSYQKCLHIIEIFENDNTYDNLFPMGEPRLSKHGLYESLPVESDRKLFQQAIQWVLNLSDGNYSLFDIAVRSNTNFSLINRAARDLIDCGLITLHD